VLKAQRIETSQIIYIKKRNFGDDPNLKDIQKESHI
jgi:hypothetical protein